MATVGDLELHRISSAEYSRMCEAGAFVDQHVELLDGLLVEMTPQGDRHHAATHALMMRFGTRLDILNVQFPLPCAEGWTPELDIALAHPPTIGGTRDRDPRLVVEVSVTSHVHDRRKLEAYALARVPRVWLVDVPGLLVSEFTGPVGSTFAHERELRGPDVLDAHVHGIDTFTVEELFRQAFAT